MGRMGQFEVVSFQCRKDVPEEEAVAKELEKEI